VRRLRRRGWMGYIKGERDLSHGLSDRSVPDPGSMVRFVFRFAPG
jgi:hypothetical protein